jgi:hypothetical protein
MRPNSPCAHEEWFWLVYWRWQQHRQLPRAFVAAELSPARSTPKKFDWSAYLQVRYTGIEQAEDLYALRHFKLMFFGQLTPHVEYYVQGIFKDGNKSDTDGRPYLQEGWIRFTHWQYAHITIGQFKPPFGLERFTPDAEIFTPDRALATDHLIPNGALAESFARDRSLQVDAWFADQRFYYDVGVFDGNGANEKLRGNGPLLAGRAVGVLHQSAKDAPRFVRFALGGAFSTLDLTRTAADWLTSAPKASTPKSATASGSVCKRWSRRLIPIAVFPTAMICAGPRWG